MTTTQQGKGGAKPRQRGRKTDQKTQKGEKAASTKRDRADRAARAEIAAPIERATVDQAPLEQAIVEQASVEQATVDQPPVEQAMVGQASVEQVMVEQAPIEQKVENGAAATLSGEVLLPEIRTHVAAQPFQAIGMQAIAAAYVDYARRSWAAGRMLAERLMTTRSLKEAVEAQGDFARQTHANFLAHSQKLCELYVDCTRQVFRPLESLAAQSTRVGR
jgi:Phasin protein